MKAIIPPWNYKNIFFLVNLSFISDYIYDINKVKLHKILIK